MSKRGRKLGVFGHKIDQRKTKHLNIKQILRDCPGTGWAAKVCLRVFFFFFRVIPCGGENT